MALVANYASSEEDLSDSDNDGKAVDDGEPREPKRPTNNGAPTAPPVDDLISDEDEEQLIPLDGVDHHTNGGGGGGKGHLEVDIPGLSTSNSLFSLLPSLTSNDSRGSLAKGGAGFVDENEDLSSIPQAKSSEKADAEAVATHRKKKKKQKEKVKIVLPSLSDLGDASDGEGDEAATARKRFRMDASSRARTSALLSMLPNPVNPVPSKEPERILVPDTVAKRPKAMSTTSSLVPRSVRVAKAASAAEAGDSDSDEDAPAATSFFTLEQEKIEPIMPPSAAASAAELPSQRAGPSRGFVEATPHAEPTGPAAGPSRPSPGALHGAVGYTDAEDLMSNNEALERLAGKHALRNKVEDFHDIVEVNQDNLKADEREWVTKALTEDAADKPGPRCTIKGQTKRKHQITYLAAVAKENEHKLKQQWAQASQNRKAAGAKYGFF